MDPVSGAVQFQSYKEFINALQAAFDDPDAKATAREKLDKFHQGKRDYSAYAAKFVTISTKLSMNQKKQIACFRFGLNKDTATILSYQLNISDILSTIAQICIPLDNNIRHV